MLLRNRRSTPERSGLHAYLQVANLQSSLDSRCWGWSVKKDIWIEKEDKIIAVGVAKRPWEEL